MPENLPRVPTTYAALRQAVEVAMIKGQQEIERSRVRTYWETGRLIHEHLLHHKERADYGTATVQRLSRNAYASSSPENAISATRSSSRSSYFPWTCGPTDRSRSMTARYSGTVTD